MLPDRNSLADDPDEKLLREVEEKARRLAESGRQQLEVGPPKRTARTHPERMEYRANLWGHSRIIIMPREMP